jgi:arginyl-tRNA synthetase
VGDAQGTYFQQLFSTLKYMGHPWADGCEHVGFGLIQLEEGKMATREGAIVYLEELLLKARDKALEVIEQKNPDLEDKEDIAQVVGIGAIKYQILSVEKIKNIKFSWTKALNFEGKSAPYIQYTHVRANSILNKADFSGPFPFNPEHLEGEKEYQLIRKMAQFPLVVEGALESMRPNAIANYAYDLASSFNNLYNSVKILEDDQKKESRLAMLDCYKTVISNAMGLLGISMPEEM